MLKRGIFMSVLTSVWVSGCVTANEIHVKGDARGTGDGSVEKPFLTLSEAAQVAQPGDTVLVHAGTYRERVDPPRGGTSDDQRITYRAVEGEQVTISGAEIVRNWERVKGDVWKTEIPNTLFGNFNPFATLIEGSWFHRNGRDHHTGAVYLNGAALDEGESNAILFSDGADAKGEQPLFTLDWFRPVDGEVVDATKTLVRSNIENAENMEKGECLDKVENGQWAIYEVAFGKSTEHMEFRVGTPTDGGIIEVRKDTVDGEILGNCTVTKTGDWQDWAVVKAPVGPISGKQNICLVFKAREVKKANRSLWFSEVGDENTLVYAQFPQVDPNDEQVEVNVRQSVFYPSQPGINYITVDGFTLECAATPWAPPNAEQIGVIGTHWSKGWIIENNTIRHSACSGVTLGKYGDEFDNKTDSADGYVGTIKRALNEGGWSMDTIGSHVVRNNHISHCGQVAVVGSMGCIASQVIGNEIHDIHWEKAFDGYEPAGIKFHGAIDTLIASNHIYRCGKFGGIWLDWMTQGTRVTGNLLHDNVLADIFVEVNHGPFVVDNNILLSKGGLYESSGGGAYVNNLFGTGVRLRFEKGRKTPFHKPHSTEVAGYAEIVNDDDRFYNNIFLERGLDAYNEWGPKWLQTGGNLYLDGSDPATHETDALVLNTFDPAIELVEKAEGWYLEFELPDDTLAERKTFLVTSERLGKAVVPNVGYTEPDGSELTIDTDFFGNKRTSKNPVVGPFSAATLGMKLQHSIKVR